MSEAIGVIVDYGHWMKASDLRSVSYPDGGYEAAKEAVVVEEFDCHGLVIARMVVRRKKRLRVGRWMPISDAVEVLGVTPQCIRQRVNRGEMRRRQHGSVIEVCVVPGKQTIDKSPATITSTPDRQDASG